MTIIWEGGDLWHVAKTTHVADTDRPHTGTAVDVQMIKDASGVWTAESGYPEMQRHHSAPGVKTGYGMKTTTNGKDSF